MLILERSKRWCGCFFIHVHQLLFVLKYLLRYTKCISHVNFLIWTQADLVMGFLINYSWQKSILWCVFSVLKKRKCRKGSSPVNTLLLRHDYALLCQKIIKNQPYVIERKSQLIWAVARFMAKKIRALSQLVFGVL